MTLSAHIDDATYRVDLSRPLSIAIPLRFDAAQPSAFGAPAAASLPLSGGGFVGDVRRGGSCNVETHTLTPHCNGTHTECAGHIAEARIAITDVLAEALFPATVASVTPESAGATAERADPPAAPADALITAAAIARAVGDAPRSFLRALVLRTLPNDAAKCVRNYDTDPPPYLSAEATEWLLAHDVQHLLVDVPSLDRMDDGGLLARHHAYWELPRGSHDADPRRCSRRTVTEFVFVPDTVPDGRYLLALQIAPFAIDAAPSRPVLFPLLPEGGGS